MKKIVLSLAILFSCGIAANAQEFKPVKIGLGLGYTIPKGGGGILFDFEPAYRVTDEIAVGLRIEAAAMAKSVGDTKASVSTNSSYTLNGQYYLSNNKFRPYVGLGTGIYSLAAVSVDVNGTSSNAVASESKFGFYPRIGFDLGHFNVNLDYNIIGATKVDGSDDIKNSYIGIRIGAFILGGRK